MEEVEVVVHIMRREIKASKIVIKLECSNDKWNSAIQKLKENAQGWLIEKE